MLKHIPSDSELDVLIDDDGNLFVFCRPVGKFWTGKLTPKDLPSSKEDVTNSATSSASIQITDSLLPLSMLAKSNSHLLMEVGLNQDIVTALHDLDVS